MPMVTYPLNNIEYSAEDAELFHVTRTSGIYANNSFDYSVTGSDNTIVIGTGIGWIKNSEFSGKVIAQKESVSLDMGLADSAYPRIDAIVIQFDANKNETNIVIKKGTAGSNPVAPSVVRTESIYELHLYHVRREAGSLSISSSNITDLRLNDSYCGLMTDSVTKTVDTTLSLSGVAADAATVGRELGKKASADFGLGGNPRPVFEEDIDDATAAGWYTVGGITINGLDVMTLRVDGDANSAVQEALVWDYGAFTHYIIRRTRGDGSAWTDWEWENPPMTLGVEYRTTERWQNSEVYVKAVDCGSLPNTDLKAISTGIPAAQVVSFQVSVLSASGGRHMLPLVSSDFTVQARAVILTSGVLQIKTSIDMSEYTAIAVIKYVKE